MSDSYRESIEAWRLKKEEELRSSDGWLTLISLYWLKPGINNFGSSLKNDLVLPKIAEHAGQFRLEGSDVFLELSPPSAGTLHGRPVSGPTKLSSDAQPNPDSLRLKSLRLALIDRGGKFAIRTRDTESSSLMKFTGRKWHPVDERYRVLAKFIRFETPRVLDTDSVVGITTKTTYLGMLEFSLDGLRHSLIAEGSPEEGFFINFKDKSNGQSTYGAGRFLRTDKANNDEVVVDFNKAYNPPCAFTEFATCPIAPRENRLGLAIDAGESVPQAKT